MGPVNLGIATPGDDAGHEQGKTLPAWSEWITEKLYEKRKRVNGGLVDSALVPDIAEQLMKGVLPLGIVGRDKTANQSRDGRGFAIGMRQV
jgi:hypothetical protein